MKLKTLLQSLAFAAVITGGAYIGLTKAKSDAAVRASAIVMVRPAPYTPMPQWVDVNGVKFRIQIADNIGGTTSHMVGYTDCATRVITLTRDGHGSRRQTMLMHELSHAAVCMPAPLFESFNNYYNSTSAEDHEGIYNFAGMWSEILLRNPDLAEYMKESDYE